MKPSEILSTYRGSRITLGELRKWSPLLIAVFLSACIGSNPLSREEVRLYAADLRSCEDQAGVVQTELRRQDGNLAGDVDGDGREDEVSLYFDRAAPPGCRSILVVDIGESRHSIPVDPSGVPRALEAPTLRSLADINDTPGSEIVINVEVGASTEFVGVFTLAGSRYLRQVELRGEGPGPFAEERRQDHLLAFGGSVGHLEAVDCTREEEVVMSAALPDGETAERYVVERRFFRATGSELALVRSRTEKRSVDAEAVFELPEFRGSPFLSCD